MSKQGKRNLVLAITSAFIVTALILPGMSKAGKPKKPNPNDAVMTMLEDIYDIVSDTNSKVTPTPPIPCTGGPVAKTGETKCYDESGTVIDCAGTGQDGEYQKGRQWPYPRFTVNGDGTVTDHLTGLIWLKNANCDGPKTWADALTYCNNLASGSCGLSDGSVAGNWRLPNRNELESLLHLGVYGPALPDTLGTGQHSEGDPFVNLQENYWSSTSYAGYPYNAWYVRISTGFVDVGYDKSKLYYVWPVRGGN